ncbi:Polyketide cyclase / dehydrase and lipid transport [compost metagenome]
MLKYAGIALAVALVVVLALAAMSPDGFRVERSTVIQAPPDKVYGLIEDFHQWRQWSPFENLDPDMQRTYRGPQKGPGAVYEWKSEGRAGEGSMRILSATPASNVTIRLDFVEPFPAHNTAEFSLRAEGGATRVTWAMYGPTPFGAKVVHLFFSMDSMVGKDFEAGLANLKRLSES